MARNKSRKMTVKYWTELSEGSRKRALSYCFPIHPVLVNMLLDEKPHDVNRHGEWWNIVFNKVRIPIDCGFYKTVIDRHTYLM